MLARRFIAIFLLAAGIRGPLSAQPDALAAAKHLESFEIVWRTVRDRHPDPNLNGLNWQAVHDSTKPSIERAQSTAEVRQILIGMLAKLASSHYAIIPGEAYEGSSKASAVPDQLSGDAGSAPEAKSPAGDAGIRPAVVADSLDVPKIPPAVELPQDSSLVRYGNLPETRLYFQSRRLPSGAGYIRFNEFLDPASVMPRFESALKSFSKSPGVILDLRGNPGGIGIMAMGIAGFFIEKDGLKLGDMKMRDATMKFAIFPRPENYSGPLAILVDGGSASTSEILAAGLQDLKRARIFGARTAGAALPSDIIRLPNGDGFQYPQASYTSVSGKVLEGAGVTPDVAVDEARTEGHDPVMEAADQWIVSTQH